MVQKIGVPTSQTQHKHNSITTTLTKLGAESQHNNRNVHSSLAIFVKGVESQSGILENILLDTCEGGRRRRKDKKE